MGNETPKHVRSWFTKAIRQMWPLAVGSISLRRGRCIRPKCPACTSGKLHTNYALYGRRGNRRFSMYPLTRSSARCARPFETLEELELLEKPMGRLDQEVAELLRSHQDQV
jgi:hypothetical protein